MTRSVLVAGLFLVVWCGCSALLWRFSTRERLLSISDASVRLGLGLLSFALSLVLVYFLLNALYRLLGGSSSFVRWSLAILNDAVRKKQ